MSKISYLFGKISGLGTYLNLIFALKPWFQAGHFEYHKPYNRKYFFFGLIKGSQNSKRIKKIRVRVLGMKI